MRGGGGAAVAMLVGDDAGNDIYKQLGTLLGSTAGCLGRSYSATTTTTIAVCTIHSLPYLARPGIDGMGLQLSTNNIT